jgi:hypothetical protein
MNGFTLVSLHHALNFVPIARECKCEHEQDAGFPRQQVVGEDEAPLGSRSTRHRASASRLARHDDGHARLYDFA